MNVLFSISRGNSFGACYILIFDKDTTSKLVVLSDHEQSRGKFSGEVVRPEINSRDTEIWIARAE